MDKTITEPIHTAWESNVARAIKEALTIHPEDWGIGSYEYAGARGVNVKVVAVIDQMTVWVDATQLLKIQIPSTIAEVLPRIKDWMYDDKYGYVEFTARNTGHFELLNRQLLVEYEIETQ